LPIIEAAEKADPSPGPFRIQRVGVWWPDDWYEYSSPRRIEEIVRWERGTLRPKYQLPLGPRSTFSFDTSEMIDYAAFFFPMTIKVDERAALSPGMKPGQEVWYYPRRGFDLWNTRYFLVPSYLVWDDPERGFASLVPRTTQVYPRPGAFDGPGGAAARARWRASDDLRVLRNDAAYPRAWVVHRARVVPPLRGRGLAERRRLMLELLYQEDEVWHASGARVHDPHAVAWVESARSGELAEYLPRMDPDASEAVEVVRDEPQRVELVARLRWPGLVVLSDVYYPGWHLTVDGRPAEVLRANRAMRGAAVGAGVHRLEYRYEPGSFRAGLALSAAGVAGLLAAGWWAASGDRRSRSGAAAETDSGGSHA
jgi:hypothetical protein